MSRINFFGSITDDVVENGFVQGGGVSYSGVAAKHLGAAVSVFSHGPFPHPYFDYLYDKGIEVYSVNGQTLPHFTIFDNEYIGTSRQQICPFVLPPITPEDFEEMGIPLPKHELCVLASVMTEFDSRLVQSLHERGNKIVSTIQGLLRVRDEQNHVHRQASEELLAAASMIDTMIFSNEDIAGLDERYVAKIIDSVQTAIITNAENGTTVFTREGSVDGTHRQFTIPAYQLTQEEGAFIHDTSHEGSIKRKAAFTGLGDTFAAAYLSRIAEGDPIDRAVAYASIVSSYKIREVAAEVSEGGIEGCPELERLSFLFNADSESGRLQDYYREAGIMHESQNPPHPEQR